MVKFCKKLATKVETNIKNKTFEIVIAYSDPKFKFAAIKIYKHTKMYISALK